VDLDASDSVPAPVVDENIPIGTKILITPAIKKRVKGTLKLDNLVAEIAQITPQSNGANTIYTVKTSGSPNDEEITRAKKIGRQPNTFVENYLTAPEIQIDPAEIPKITANRQDIKKSKKSSALNAFLSPANNAIVRSFKSSGGKGLAGFIESMNFDWYNQTTWEVEQEGSIAPKMCKVTINFTPIHDISPGIDHHGYNRAPVYRVGGRS